MSEVEAEVPLSLYKSILLFFAIMLATVVFPTPEGP